MRSLPRSTRVLVFLSGPAALAVLALVALVATSSQAAPGRLVAKLEGTDVWAAGARPTPRFALRDQNGALVTNASLRGRVWAVTFLDSHCTNLCPVTARGIMSAKRLLGPSYRLTTIVVSVLPRYDTPAHIRAFARRTGLRGDWHWLRGTQRQLSPVWVRFGIEVITGQQHTAALYLVDQKGDVRVADGVPFLPSQLAASVRALERRTR